MNEWMSYALCVDIPPPRKHYNSPTTGLQQDYNRTTTGPKHDDNMTITALQQHYNSTTTDYDRTNAVGCVTFMHIHET
jgi:hypothetical protein